MLSDAKCDQNIKLTIAYNGGKYAGWQTQPNGVAVQQVITDAIYQLTKQNVSLSGSGRTDAGVHAAAQIANFHIKECIPPERFAYALNTVLPDDIRIINSECVDADFHSRFNAIGKTYCYRIYNSKIEDPFLSPYTWNVKHNIDREVLKKAVKDFIGTYDFKGFMASGSAVASTIRTIYSIDIVEHEDLIEIYYSGNGFLYNMVRIITGTIVECATGKIPLENLNSIILSKKRDNAGITAQAKGLMLMQVHY